MSECELEKEKKINLKVGMKVKVSECMWDSGRAVKADIGLSAVSGQGWLWMQRKVKKMRIKILLPV